MLKYIFIRFEIGAPTVLVHLMCMINLMLVIGRQGGKQAAKCRAATLDKAAIQLEGEEREVSLSWDYLCSCDV